MSSQEEDKRLEQENEEMKGVLEKGKRVLEESEDD